MDKDRQLQERVFINDIDSFSSKCIAKCLAKHSLECDGSAEKECRTLKLNDSGSRSYRVVGTISDGSEDDRPYVLEAYIRPSREKILQKLMECDVIVYNITQHPEQVDEARWAVTALHDKINDFGQPKKFILISTVMTWACSEPINSDDLELPFTDDDFRRRKAHPNFEKHLELEKMVTKVGKMDRALFSTYVVVSGLQYGLGEQVFHLFFKMSWLGEENEIPVFGEGNNIVPTIHVCDLARVIQKIIEHQPKPYYLLAVDYSNNTMEDIVKTITSALGFGKIQRKTFEEAFLQQDLSIMDIDLLHVNLCMEGVHLKELFTIHWLCEFGLVENIELVVEEYRQIRGLLPIRACVLGPPAVGKSTVSRQICDYYKLHHVRLNETISETISHLEYMMRHTFSDPENDDSATATEAQELLSIINDNMEQNGVISLPLGYLDDQMLVKVMMDKLISNPCKNQGFVLDGFPKTYEQAKELFHVDEHESDERTPISLSNKKIMPDSLLKDRVMNLPEKLVQEHKYEQEHFLQILAKYREKNMEEESVVNYLEELDINPLLIEITSISIPDNQLLMHTICERVGKPRNYAQNNEKIQKEGMMLIETTVKAEREQKELEEARQRSAHWEMWTKTLEEKRQWEVQQLEVLSVQMKTYLTEHIITTLSLGLIACGSAWPEDPIDFMAEYLIKNNP
ncbi:adenylate kinase 7 isoform X3 [Syngnathoides biaculeatus]|uniref:adenylate kinase 7 isoform X3 n=1 Tax=Syngnathoides biaculeatus TaxID=300417 RepID=UPI002ADDA175|nr:adenylate kinase 7 isoform X3 [Syngnathoides biaculeatus]